MNQCWRVKDTIRAEWRKDSQTASSLIFFVIDTASWFAFRLQQERMGSHVHRASRCRNLIKKKKYLPNERPFFLIVPLSLPLLSAFLVSSPSLFFSTQCLPPPRQNRSTHCKYYSVWNLAVTSMTLGKEKKNCTFHLSSWLESHLDKSSVFFWKKKKQSTNKANSRWPCPEYITRA